MSRINYRQETHWLQQVCLIAGILSILVVITVGNYQTAYADSIPGGNVTDPVVRAVDIAKPAVVRIITTINSHLQVNFAPGK